MTEMRRYSKVLSLLTEKKVADTNRDKLKIWEYEGMIKRHVEKCPNCREFLEQIHEKSKRSDADFSQSRLALYPSSDPP